MLKTILVRHRARFQRNLFGMFGERVPMMSHLGEALNRATPRAEAMVAPAHKPRAPRDHGDVAMPRPTLASLPPDVLQDNDELSHGFSLAWAMMPKR